LLLIIPNLMEGLQSLSQAFGDKAEEFKDILKMGRTQLQDAVPMSLGQEFGAFATTVAEDVERLKAVSGLFHEINMGATAIGTGINAPPGYAPVVADHLKKLTGLPMQTSVDLIEATWDTGAYVQLSGILRRIAVKLCKESWPRGPGFNFTSEGRHLLLDNPWHSMTIRLQLIIYDLAKRTRFSVLE
jgi:aspartate ammonia-lyase